MFKCICRPFSENATDGFWRNNPSPLLQTKQIILKITFLWSFHFDDFMWCTCEIILQSKCCASECMDGTNETVVIVINASTWNHLVEWFPLCRSVNKIPRIHRSNSLQLGPCLSKTFIIECSHVWLCLHKFHISYVDILKSQWFCLKHSHPCQSRATIIT